MLQVNDPNHLDHDHTQCRELLSSLSDYVDGDLSVELCAMIEQHMQGCENCRIVVDTLRKTIYLVHATNEEPPMPEDIRLRLYSKLELEDYINPD